MEHKKKVSFRCNPNFLCLNIIRKGTSKKILFTSFYELHPVLNIQIILPPPKKKKKFGNMVNLGIAHL